MHILSADAIRQWDQYTIQHEPIASIDLMERAAGACVSWLEKNGYTGRAFHIYCGKGNNGGDGLAMARMLLQMDSTVTVHILEFGHLGTADFQTNLQRLHEMEATIIFIQDESHIYPIDPGDIVIDCLLGTGLNRPLEGLTLQLVTRLNEYKNEIIAIDIPTGLSTDTSSKGHTAIHADHTLTFQCNKPAFLVSENEQSFGRLHILDIGLHPQFLETLPATPQVIDDTLIRKMYTPRNDFSHKGNFGHALMIAGSYGKMGAAVLAVKACLHTGAGLTTAFIPRCGYPIMQLAVPEAMTVTDKNDNFFSGFEEELSTYNAIGIGPGLGTDLKTAQGIASLLPRIQKGLLLDADALNIVSQHKELLKQLPAQTILTPHPKEFERLFGKEQNDFDRMAVALQKAQEHNIIIVLKGHHSFIALPDGNSYFNNNGNAGMAKGGTGDVLTGIITALLAQNYPPWQAALLGVYLHGFAGDIAAETYSQEAMTASQLISCLSDAFLVIAGKD